MLVINAGIDKMLFRIANRDDPDQTASWEAVWVQKYGKCLLNFKHFSFSVLK